MDNKLICIKCGKPPHKYCAKCRAKTRKQFSPEDFWKEILEGLTHIHPAIFFTTFKNISCSPGKSLNQFLEGKTNHLQKPFPYFVLCVSVYGFCIENFLKPKGWYVGVSRQLDVVQLALIMLGLSLIARIICGGQFKLVQVFSVYAYVYGTAFLLNILIISLEHYLLPALHSLPGLWLIIVTDIPTTVFILVSIWSLFRERNIGWQPFVATAVVSFTYYLVMIWWFLY